MKELTRQISYMRRIFLRDKYLIFWLLLYPIILTSFFQLGFGNLRIDSFEKIPLATDNQELKDILREIEVLELVEVNDYEKALEDQLIKGFVDENLNLRVKKSGLSESILKDIVREIAQVKESGLDFKSLDYNRSYINMLNQKEDLILIIFYSIIAMFSTYGMFVSMEIPTMIQGNLSPIGARVSMTSINKLEFLISGGIFAFNLNIITNGILLVYIRYFLRIQLFTALGPSLLILSIANILGTSIGFFVGSLRVKNQQWKNIAIITVNLILSFSSGMIGEGFRENIDRISPMINRLNPIAIVTDGLYRVNMLSSYRQLGEGLVILGLYSLILFSISYLLLRRRSYDSI